MFDFKFRRHHFVALDTAILISLVSYRRPVLTNVTASTPAGTRVLDATPDGKLIREKGTDMAKKESVAQTRYMDKQKVASFQMAPGWVHETQTAENEKYATITNQITHEDAQLVNEHQTRTARKSCTDLKAEILDALPTLIGQRCVTNDPHCHLNQKLLQYFL